MGNRLPQSVKVLFFGVTFCLFLVSTSPGQETKKPAAMAPATKAVPEVKSPAQPKSVQATEKPAPKVEKKTPVATAPAPEATPPKPDVITAPPSAESLGEQDDWLDPNNMLASRGPIVRLASVPNMFGDGSENAIRMCDYYGCTEIKMIPPGGGRGASKISENDKALPMDRVFFSYNHFHNAMETFVSNYPTGSLPIDQYTIGAEKTFHKGLSSVELRLPLLGMPGYATPDFSADGGEVGNLAIILKRLLILTETTAVAAGLGIDTPTGSDITGQGIASSYRIHNNAVHLSPFVGGLTMPSNRCFFQGFLQVDVATNDNQVVFGDQDLGDLHEQTLLYADLSVGYWLYRNPCACLITGIAPTLEYHYTSTLQDADSITGNDGNQMISYGYMYNRMDISNVTVGLHTELGKTTVRVGGVFPLGTRAHRAFDAEVQLSINRQF
ncbi:MAG: hypothetical protein JXM70_29025 [Pirellulales bacterium]|nr:hypothetical protein [Pirellulales bacterium]